MERRVAFTGKGEVTVEDFTPDQVKAGQVRAQGICSLMSTGTETIVLHRKFEPDTHWDDWVKYPFYPGYAFVGEVTECGPDVEDLKPGQLIASRGGHATSHILDANSCKPIPDGITPKQACWFALGKIAFMSAKAAKYFLGDKVLIIGGGPVGQMALRWAVAAGAQSVVMVDMVPYRLERAKKGGATAVIDRPAGEAEDEITKAFGGEPPEIVVDSTGIAAVFSDALKLCAPRGRVIVLGDTGTPSEQHLTSDVIARGLTITGAHDGHETDRWNEARICQLFFKLVGSGAINLEGMNSHSFSLNKAEEAYNLVETDRSSTMGIQFDLKNL